MPSDDQKDHMTQQPPESSSQQQQQQSNTKTTSTANANPSSIISNELANMTHAFKEKKKLVRRAFSMPRNLFRLSRRVKNNNTNNNTNADTAVKNASSDAKPSIKTSNSCNQSVQTGSIDEENQLNLDHSDNNKHRTLPVSLESSEVSQQPYPPEAKPHTEQDNKHRLFRRSTWKKFLFSRFILQSINLKVRLVLLRIYYYFISIIIINIFLLLLRFFFPIHS